MPSPVRVQNDNAAVVALNAAIVALNAAVVALNGTHSEETVASAPIGKATSGLS
ncbi:hypothetical protein F4779DRAFT_621639 [Xylariaceae sp. FL0662B]|nr:hypothetical protein F4779DRAFT_621639 [Xylariaceae sp. FL0662B]